MEHRTEHRADKEMSEIVLVLLSTVLDTSSTVLGQFLSTVLNLRSTWLEHTSTVPVSFSTVLYRTLLKTVLSKPYKSVTEFWHVHSGYLFHN